MTSNNMFERTKAQQGWRLGRQASSGFEVGRARSLAVFEGSERLIFPAGGGASTRGTNFGAPYRPGEYFASTCSYIVALG